MKKNKMLRIASVLLVAVILSTCAISGTFAKYTSEGTAYASARVAKWDVKLNGNAVANDFAFNLFETINGYDTGDTDGTETDVANKLGDGKKVIAPGTQGSCSITLRNKSEVNATYTVALDVSAVAGVPLEFSINGGAWGANPAAVTDALSMDATVDTTITISWRWAFDANDDTALGTAGTLAEPTIKATVTVEQVN